MHLKRINQDERDQEKPRVWRAAIYVCGREKSSGAPRYPLSIDQQRVLCHFVARTRRLVVVDEFEDTRPHETLRPNLHQALETAQKMRLDYLIVASMAALTDDPSVAFEVAWRLGHAGTVPLPAEDECELRWVGVQSIRS